MPNFAEYGMTRSDFNLLRGFQENRCPICLKPFTAGRLARIDHDHKTGEVRGLTCNGCNTLLGLFHDNQQKLQRAAEYLLNPPAQDTRLWDEPRRHRDAPPKGN